MRFLRANRDAQQKWLQADPGARIADHLFLVDPLGNLMMCFPKDPDLKKMRSKNLLNSHIG